MTAYAVKHISDDRGPITSIMKNVKKQPYSYTSKPEKAEGAAKGRFVYVIEVQRVSGATSYHLGYKYRAREAHKAAGGSLWGGQFEYKNSVAYGVASDGLYFDSPVLITDSDFIDWYKSETFGMAEIPGHLLPVLESIFSNPSNGAKAFKI